MKYVTQEEYNELENKIKELQKELSNISVKKEWYDTTDVIRLSNHIHGQEMVEFESNYGTWSNIKNKFDIYKDKDILVIEVCGDDGDDAFTSISFKQMKVLRDYLNQKINYLESE